MECMCPNSKGEYKHFQEPAQEVVHVTGAGDTVLAVLAYPIEEGHTVFHACEKACYNIPRAVEHRGVLETSKRRYTA